MPEVFMRNSGHHLQSREDPSDADELTITAAHAVRPDAEGLRHARGFVRTTLESWRLDPSTANAAIDVAHELVSNAVQHGEPPVQLSLSLRHDATSVLVSVSDASPVPARLLPYRSGVSERGLGLRLVAQLSTEWAQTPTTTGKSVWATVRPAPRI